MGNASKKADGKKNENGSLPPIEVGYWEIRGLAAALRMMCAYKGVEYKDSQYACTPKDGGGFSKDSWLVDAKPALQKLNPLMNLPYVKVGDQVVTQSNACLQFLGETLGLPNSTANQQILCEVFDLRNAAVKVFYHGVFTGGPMPSAAEGKPVFEAHIGGPVKGHYAKFEAWLGMREGAKFFAGERPSACDFHVFEMCDQHEIAAKKLGLPSPLADFPKLRGFYEGFRALPQLAKYFDSDKYALPMNNKMAWMK